MYFLMAKGDELRIMISMRKSSYMLPTVKSRAQNAPAKALMRAERAQVMNVKMYSISLRQKAHFSNDYCLVYCIGCCGYMSACIFKSLPK